jgi:hypothetical protein
LNRIATGVIPIQAHRTATMQNVFELRVVDAHTPSGLLER